MKNERIPHYVDFNIAKWLKEIGFDEYVDCYFYPSSYNQRPIWQDATDANVDYYDEYPIGVSLRKYKWNSHHPDADFISRPKEHQVIKWFLENHKLHIFVDGQYKKGVFSYWWNITGNKKKYYSKLVERFNSPQEAYLGCFYYIKENNLI